MKINRLIPVLLALAMAHGLAFAQQTTGRLTGTVTDPQGGVLPGVTVTVTSPSLIGGARTAQTGADGSFTFPALDPGFYTVRLELEGFATQEQQNVQVLLDRTIEIFPQLEIGQFGEEVTVVSDVPVVDTTQAGIGQVFSTEYLNRASVGSAGRSYQAVAGQAAGVVGETNPSVLGSTGAENAFFIDGLDTTDPVTATFGTNFNFDAIREVSVLTSGFEAEYGRATGGVINLITKSGGNEFDGTFDVRYRTNDFAEEGDHFDPELNETKFINPSATLGGPIARDKIWFFASYEDIDSENTPSGSPTTFDFEGQNYLGKITWQIAPSWRAVVKGSSDPAEITNANAGRFRSPEATRTQEQGGDIFSAELSAVLPSEMLWDLQVGANRQELNSFPTSGDFDTPGIFDQATGLFTNNFTNMQFSNRDRDEARTSLTYFVDNLGGSHEFKGGISYDDLFFRTSNNTVTGFSYTDDSAGVPPGELTTFLLTFSPIQPALEFDGELLGAYIQDSWQVRPNVTVKLGVRYDEVSFNNELGGEVATLEKVQPRVGFAWDINNDAKTVVRGNWGRFMHPSALTLPSFARETQGSTTRFISCSAFFGNRTVCENFARSRGGTVITDPLNRDPLGFAFFDVLGSLPNEVDPNLETMYADSWSIGVERQIANRTSVELTYVSKETDGIFEDVCDGNFPTVGGSDHCDFYVMSNVPQAVREYEGILLRVESRLTDWLHLNGNYVYSKSQGSIEDTQNAGVDFDIFPDHYTNTFGYLSDDRRHRVKLNGFVQLPLDFTFGVDAFWSSAFAYDSVIDLDPPSYGDGFVEPRGSRRANNNYQFDFELRKGFEFGPLRTELIGTVLNAFSDERPTAVCEDVEGCGAAFPHGTPTTFQVPRRYEVGFRIEF